MIFLMPLYVNIVMIYSICNIQDVSWGNRATENKNATDTRESLEQYRAIALVLWICVNTGYGYGTLYLDKNGMSIYRSLSYNIPQENIFYACCQIQWLESAIYF